PLARPIAKTVSAVRKGSLRAGPAANPSPRRMRPKCSQFLVGIDPGSGIDGAGEELSRARTAQPFEVLLVFDDRAEGRLDRRLIELGLPERDQRSRPVERLGDDRQLLGVQADQSAE